MVLLIVYWHDFDFKFDIVSGKQLHPSKPTPHILALVILIATFLVFLVGMVAFYYGLCVFPIA